MGCLCVCVLCMRALYAMLRKQLQLLRSHPPHSKWHWVWWAALVCMCVLCICASYAMLRKQLQLLHSHPLHSKWHDEDRPDICSALCAALHVASTCAALLVQHCKWLQHVAFPPTHPPTLHIASDLLGLTSALRCAYLCVFGKAVPQTTPKIGTYLDASWSHLSTDL
jgi:ABC-type Fe3+ transport system permease subunit